jgi:hypothetical protein
VQPASHGAARAPSAATTAGDGSPDRRCGHTVSSWFRAAPRVARLYARAVTSVSFSGSSRTRPTKRSRKAIRHGLPRALQDPPPGALLGRVPFCHGLA